MDEELPDASKPLPGFSDKTWAKFCELKEKLKEQRSKERLAYKNKKAKKKHQANNEDPGHDCTPESKDYQGVCTSAEKQMNKHSCGEDASSDWLSVTPYLNINSHLVQTTGTNTKPKSGLELRIDDALKKGDLNEASELNDHLANREFAKQIVDACDAKRYAEKRKAEEEYKKLNKKTNLAWGFEQKRRWETKGNM